ncbi:HK97 family phage prohead protease [Marinobacter qingdaonensis]|uniref:HK97 family phage prohead protease n=1 Tax=Marinobacter qingdaonensis TaxID=3108486 RepID=A0ABU5NUN0_9GAMM|nr:HK97 family phage prohead protease [Marinobacter sp. ASW11-75]MEA1079520.1 HK97 family phage prohead protease [Marinobacter sp. ASW11-75]
MSLEKRALGFVETRAEGEEGIFSGYVVTWDSVDSYNTSFKKGSFKKTIAERAGKVKLLWNHDFEGMPLGSILELKEDDKGLWFRAQLSLATERGKEAYELLKIGAINTMSFGFKILKDAGFKDGVRQITEVQLMEISPVNFESNPTATINDVRATDFSETLDEQDMRSGGRRILSAFEDTIWDIWYDAESPEQLMQLMDAAWGSAHTAYLEWLQKMTESEPELRGNPEANDLSRAFIESMEGKTPLEFAARSTLNLDQVESLRRGNTVDEAAAQALPDNLRSIHASEKTRIAEDLIAQISSLSVELRSTVLDAFVKPEAPQAPAAPEEPQVDDDLMTQLRDALNQIAAQ